MLRGMFTRLAWRVRPFYLMAFVAGGVAVLYLVLPGVSALAGIVVVMFIFGALVSQYDPAVVTALSDVLGPGERDLGTAIWVTVNALAGLLLAPVLGNLADAAGLPSVFVLSGLVALALVGGLLLLSRAAARHCPHLHLQELHE